VDAPDRHDDGVERRDLARDDGLQSLDDPGRYKPQAVTYAMRGYAWDQLDPGVPKFDKMPPM